MAATGQVVLVLGGARSGKSAHAERVVAAAAARAGVGVCYVATGPVPRDDDPDWQARVDVHRGRRPGTWATLEVGPGGDLGGALRTIDAAAVVDSLGAWLSGFERFAAPVGPLCDVLGARAAAGLPTVVVSEEVGLGVHPPTEVGRRFADALGEMNQAVAALARRVVLVVAGRALELDGAGA